MDEELAGYIRELVEAIRAAVGRDPSIQACRTRARAAGYDLRLSLDAVVGIARAHHPPTRQRHPLPPLQETPITPTRHPITEADRRFLRSLRIAANEAASEEV